jgi:peptidoglycan/xylan/chitin deacetylase (PgdA/CDA1 family)
MRPLALAYHGIGAVPVRDDPFGLFVSPRRLLRHVAWLRRRGYTLVTFGELVERGSDGLAALTFDDGFADNEQLLALGVPATVFVTTGWMGGEHPSVPGARMIEADGVRRLHAGGIEIGGHTVTHPYLDRLGYDEAVEEMRAGRERLEALIDAPVPSFAYPFGTATEETVRACGAAGFRAACRTSGNGSVSTPLNYPRENMDGPGTITGLRLKIAGRYEPLMSHYPARVVRRIGRWLRPV